MANSKEPQKSVIGPKTTNDKKPQTFDAKKFEERFPRIIPESTGDLADQAELDIEADLQANIERARSMPRRQGQKP